MLIDWRKRRPTALTIPQTEEDPIKHLTDNEEEITPTKTRDVAQETAQATTQAINTIALQSQQYIMSIAHLLLRIKITNLKVTHTNGGIGAHNK